MNHRIFIDNVRKHYVFFNVSNYSQFAEKVGFPKNYIDSCNKSGLRVVYRKVIEFLDIICDLKKENKKLKATLLAKEECIAELKKKLREKKLREKKKERIEERYHVNAEAASLS